MCFSNAVALQLRLVRALLHRAEREVEALDREPAAERRERAVDQGVVAARQLGSRDAPRWTTLRIGLYSDAGSLIGASAENRTVIRSAKSSVPRTRAEDAEERPDRPVARRHGREHLGQRRAARPPELVRVRVDHPVGAVLGRRETRHARHPLVLAKVLAGLADEVDVPRARVSLEHLGRAVLRPVVGRDHQVGAGVEVEREPLLDDVDLVPREQRHDQRHRRASLRATRRGPSSSALEPALERAHAVLGADDAVDLDEHGGLRRVGGVLGGTSGAGTRAVALAREDERPVVRAQSRKASRKPVSTASVPPPGRARARLSSTANEA